jgi:uncharacterized protein YegP (UPF0339 family)
MSPPRGVPPAKPKKPKPLHVEIFKSATQPQRTQPWYVRLVADNGAILNRSEGYFSKWNAKRAAQRMYPGLRIEYTDQHGQLIETLREAGEK